MDHTTIVLTELVNNAKTHLDLLGYTEGTKKIYPQMESFFDVCCAKWLRPLLKSVEK